MQKALKTRGARGARAGLPKTPAWVALLLILPACSAITGGDLSKLHWERPDAGSALDDAGSALDGGEAGPAELDDAGSVDASKPIIDHPVEPVLDAAVDAAVDQVDDAGNPVDVHDASMPPERDASVPVDPCANLPTFSSSAHYHAGDAVQAGARRYRCNDGITSSWCELEGYEPGSGPYWHDAWQDLGPCHD